MARNIPLPGHRENDIVLQLARQLKGAGNQVSVCFPAEWLPVPQKWLSGIHLAVSQVENKFHFEGLDIHVLKYIRLPRLAFSYLLAGFFWPKKTSEKPGLVHAHYVMPDGWIGLKLSKRHHCPLVVSVRQGDMDKLLRLPKWAPVKAMYLHVLGRADLIFSPSFTVVEQLATIGFSAQLMPHGVDDRQGGEFKPRCSDTVRVLVAATLIPGKRVDWVISAIGAYDGIAKIKLIILGEGESRAELQMLAEQHSLDVEFLGHVSRVEVFLQMQHADIFALPSARETFGLVYLEAALRECAVIATRNTGVDGCFEDGTEMVFASHVYEEFCCDLWRLIDSGETRAQIAKKGMERVRKDYLWGSVLDGYMNALSRLAR